MSDSNALRALVLSITPGDIADIIAIFAYQGFNPEMVFKHLAAIKAKKNITDDIFTQDITTLVCLGCIAGNYTAKNKDKRDEKGTAKADELFAKYELAMGSIGTNKRAVTLPRVLLTFPVLTHKINIVCPERNFPGPFQSSSLPQIMKSPVFPALIPSGFGTNSKTALLIAYCSYTCDQSKAINPDAKTATLVDIFNKQFGYVTIGHQSPEPAEPERQKLWKEILPILQSSWDSIVSVLRIHKKAIDNAYTIPSKFGTVATAADPVSSAGPSTGFD